MRGLVLPLAIFIGAAIGSTGSTIAETGLTFKAGLGYEFLSQEFFLDSLVGSGADSLAARTELRTTYLDDFKGQISLTYLPYDDYRLEISSVMEQTPDQSRIRLTTDFRPRLGPTRLEWNSEIEWRDGPSDSVVGDPGYLSGNGRAKLVLPVSKSLSLWGQARSDFVRFDSVGYGTFNYHRFGGQFGMSQRFTNYSSLTANLFVMNREVPDTTDQDYLSYGLDGSAFIFYEQGEIDALGRYETRDYDRFGDLGDYSRFALSIRNRHNLRGAIIARQELEIETIRYDSNALLPDHTRAELALLVGLSADSWSATLGPALGSLSEHPVEASVISEEYLEFGVKAQLDLVYPGLIFGSLGSETGRRDIIDEGVASDLHSDFVYERLSLLSDWSIGPGLNLNLLLSIDWEWHANPEENNRLVLLTTGLYYAF